MNLYRSAHAAALEIIEARQGSPRYFRQLPPRRRQAKEPSPPFDQSAAEDFLQFLELPTQMALAHRIALSRGCNPARARNGHEAGEPLQRQTAPSQQGHFHIGFIAGLARFLTQSRDEAERAWDAEWQRRAEEIRDGRATDEPADNPAASQSGIRKIRESLSRKCFLINYVNRSMPCYTKLGHEPLTVGRKKRKEQKQGAFCLFSLLSAIGGSWKRFKSHFHVWYLSSRSYSSGSAAHD